MKIQRIISLLSLVGCCAVSAQTTNSTTQTNTPSLLTKDQAVTLAMRLADEKLDGKGYVNFEPFEQKLITSKTQTRFVDGRWNLTLFTGDPNDRYTASVELAADGSTNAVNLKIEGGFP